MMQAYHWCLAGPVINGHNVEAAGTFSHPAFGEEALRCAHYDVLFFPRSAQLRQRRHVIPYRARANFDKSQRLSIIADEVEFTLYAPRRVIPRNEHVSIPPQISVSVGLSSNPGAPRLQFPGLAGEVSLFA
jgi:hypothetical protein